MAKNKKKFLKILSVLALSFYTTDLFAVEIDMNSILKNKNSPVHKNNVEENKAKSSSVKTEQEKETFQTDFITSYEVLSNKLSINGKIHLFHSYTNEDFRKNDDLERLMQSDGRLNVHYEKELRKGLSYYTDFEVKKKYNNATRLRSLVGIQNDKYGTFELASYNPIGNQFKSSYSIRAGSNGAWSRNINTGFSGSSAMPNGLLTEFDTVLGYYTDTDLTSVLYRSPKFQGLQFGASYTSDTRYKNKPKKNFPYRDALSLAATYEKKINNDLGVTVSFLTEMGSPYDRDLNNNGSFDDERLEDLHSYFGSVLLEYKKFSALASVGNFRHSNRLKKVPIIVGSIGADQAVEFAHEGEAANFIDLAVAYKFNKKFKASVSYFCSENGQDYAAFKNNLNLPSTNGRTGKNNFYNTSLALEYKMMDGLFTPYIELNRFIVKNNDAILKNDLVAMADSAKYLKDNTGYVFMIGANALF